MAYESAPLWTGEYLHPGDAGLPAYAPYGYQWIGKRGMKFTPPVVRGMGQVITASGGYATEGGSAVSSTPINTGGGATDFPLVAIPTPGLPPGYNPATGTVTLPAGSSDLPDYGAAGVIQNLSNQQLLALQQNIANAVQGVATCPYATASDGTCCAQGETVGMFGGCSSPSSSLWIGLALVAGFGMLAVLK